MLTAISIIIILVCLVVILNIVLKKFPALAILNVHNMPAEKEAQFKEQLLRQKVERDLSRVSGFLGRFWLFISKSLAKLLDRAHHRLKKAKQSYRLRQNISYPEKQKRIKVLKAEAEEERKEENYAAAEEKLIEAISLDQKNLGAFFSLAGLYDEQKKWPEARQTYEYALKLARQYGDDETIMGELTLAEIHFSLSQVEKEGGDLESATENIRAALDIEPSNPRFLDLILDLSIMRKDKETATQAWEKLAGSNPENNKLGEWEEKIQSL